MRGACTSLGACLASLGVSLALATTYLQFIAALIAVVTGALGLILMWRKVRANL